MTPEVRKVETTVHETGVAVADRVDVTYELGVDINGAWIRFASVPGQVVDAAVAAQPPAPEASASSASDEPAAGEASPTEAPQAEAASSGGGTS